MSDRARTLVALAAAATAVALVVAGGAVYAVFGAAPLWGTPEPPFTVAFAFIAAVIAVRRPRERFLWVLLLPAVSAGAYVFCLQYASASFTVRPLPGGTAAAWVATWSWWPAFATFISFLLLLFPDGRLPSPRWRPVAIFDGLVLVTFTVLLTVFPGELLGTGVPNPLGVDALSALGPVLDPVIGITHLAVMFSSLAAVIVRFRRSHGDERQQLKWFAAGVVAAVVVLSAQLMFPQVELQVALSTVVVMMVPLAMGLAILRYRLYDIDRVISRTLGYAVVTALLAGVYIALVTAASLLSPAAESSPVTVAVATLAAAALFRPVRARVQRAVDHRFNRSRYDAARVVEAYRATVRDLVDLDAVTAELTDAARRTVQPAAAGLWLRGAAR